MQIIYKPSQADIYGGILQRAMMAGYAEAKKDKKEKEAAKTMLSKMMLEEQLKREAERERAKDAFARDMVLRGGQELQSLEGVEGGNVLVGPYQRYWHIPTLAIPKEAQDYIGAVPTGKPGEVHFYRKPPPQGWKPQNKEEALDLKLAGAGWKPQTKEEALDLKKAQAGASGTKQDLKLAKALTVAERNITNADEPGKVQADINFFNKYSDLPYVYVHRKEKKSRFGVDRFAVDVDKIEKIRLPKGIRAADVYYTAAEEGLSIEEVLRKLGILEDTNAD
jgi:hypothetical protein